jgi:hypothetical protein
MKVKGDYFLFVKSKNNGKAEGRHERVMKSAESDQSIMHIYENVMMKPSKVNKTQAVIFIYFIISKYI